MTKVHHLFPPLAFLMDACLDLFDEDVQREVASPFMTQVLPLTLKVDDDGGDVDDSGE